MYRRYCLIFSQHAGFLLECAGKQEWQQIGVPSGSIGEKLYNAKIYLNTPDLFAWTIVIIVISFVFEKCFLGIVSRVVYMIEHR